MILRQNKLIRRTSAGALGLALLSSGVLTGCAQGPRQLFTNMLHPKAAEKQAAEGKAKSATDEPAKQSYFAKLSGSRKDAADDSARVTANRLTDEGTDQSARPGARSSQRSTTTDEPSGNLLASFMKRSGDDGAPEVTDPFLENVDHADYNESPQKRQSSRIEQVSRNEDPLLDRYGRRTPAPNDYERQRRMKSADASATGAKRSTNPFSDGFDSGLDRLRAEVEQEPDRDQQSQDSFAKLPAAQETANPFDERSSNQFDPALTEREHELRARESELRRREMELKNLELELQERAAQTGPQSPAPVQEFPGSERAVAPENELAAAPARSIEELRSQAGAPPEFQESELQQLPPSANLRALSADYNQPIDARNRVQPVVGESHDRPAAAREQFALRTADANPFNRDAAGLMRESAPQPSETALRGRTSRLEPTPSAESLGSQTRTDARPHFGRAESSMIVDASSIPSRLAETSFTLSPSGMGADASGRADGNMSTTIEPRSQRTATQGPRTVANHPTDVWQPAPLASAAPAAPEPPVANTPTSVLKMHRQLLEQPAAQETAAAPLPPVTGATGPANSARAKTALADLAWDEEPQAAGSRRIGDHWGTLALLAASGVAGVVGYSLRHKLRLIRRRRNA